MFFEKLKDRYNVIILVFIIIVGIIVLRLANLMIVQGEEYREQSENRIYKEIPITAPRGEIRDKFGNLIAGNRPSFTVQIMRNELDDYKINQIGLDLLNILELNNDEYIDNFPIIKTEDGNYAFTYDIDLVEWKETYGLIGINDGEEAFNILKERYNIEEEDPYEAQLKLLAVPDLTIPISIRESTRWRFSDELDKEDWLKSYGFEDMEIKAGEAFDILRESYEIPEGYSFDDARKVMIFRQHIRSGGYLQYNPIKIAQDISPTSVAQIEENILDFPGISIAIESIRYYPEEDLASHLLGYIGRISQQHEIDKYINELGYKRNDLIGKTGLEHKFEEDLKGEDGYQRVLVDSNGRLVEVLERKEPVPGDTLYLSIDSNLQKRTEEVLEEVLQAIRTGGTYETKWGRNTFGTRPNAESGAVVVTDVKTGKVLTLVSYPGYDPNLFSTVISGPDWQSLMPENERDSLAPRPLVNMALSTAVQPGSTFKMIVGLAGLEQGLSPDYQILDKGYIRVGGHSFGNWLWNQQGGTMGYQNLKEAIRDSNNYYFYSLATGYDYGADRPLPIEMTPEILIDYTKRFGLNEPTGIEIDVPREKSGGVPSIERKLEVTKAMLRNYLNRQMSLDDLDPEIVDLEKENLENIIDDIVGWTEENPSRGTTLNRMRELGIKEEMVNIYTDIVKYSYFNQAKWSIADTMNFSIGQGEHAYTPIQKANYMAIVANDGYRYKVSTVDKIKPVKEGESQDFPTELIERIDLKDYGNLEEIRIGMHEVTTTGSARSYLSGLPVETAAKTGTAQRSGKIPPIDEEEYLREHLSSFGLSLNDVELRMAELKEENEDNPKYVDDAFVMRQSIKALNPNINDKIIDQYKEDYDNFTWFTGFAPYDDPQIAISILLPQGGSGGYGAPIFREVVAEYMGLNASDDNEKFSTENRLLP